MVLTASDENQVKDWSLSKKVAAYFDKCVFIYLRYSKEHLHFGFWDDTTADLSEALVNETQYVVDLLDIQKDDVILDAGCGFGGSARYIVSKFGARTIGINISAAQIKKAEELSHGIKNHSLLEFSAQDFARTTYPDKCFMKIFAIESVCHASDKAAFAREAYRLLKSKGRLVVADGFLARTDLTEKETKLALTTGRGYAVPNMDTPQDFATKLHQAGFQKIGFQNKTRDITKTAWLVHKRGKKWLPITYVAAKLRLIPIEWYYHNVSSYNQKKLLDQNICCYGVFTAEKQ
ncbi:MAG: SAM-dependent methyltransferase [Candidatus Hodarchaeales archaeon]|jgi:cyclopropane fatty-acyl-phospholipid synthase-like methyltransferase